MDTIKLTAKFELPGSQLLPQKVCESDPKNNCNHAVLRISYVEKNGKHGKPFTKYTNIHFNTRKSIPAVQVINMTDGAFKYMTSSEVPSFSNIRIWKKLNPTQRLEMHLLEIARAIKGTLINYEVYPD